MQALKNKLATLSFIGLVTLALLPVSLSVCGPAAAKLRHHAKKLHPVARGQIPALRAMHPPGHAIVRDVLPEENRELKNLSENYATVRRVVRPPRDGSHAAWATRTHVTDRRPILILQSVLNL